MHIQDFPEYNKDLIDVRLERHIDYAKEIIKLGRTIRLEIDTPSRQPLSELVIITTDKSVAQSIEITETLIKNELNVKKISIDNDEESWVKLVCKPNYAKLGPKFQKEIKKIVEFIENLTQEDIRKFISEEKVKFEKNYLILEDVLVLREPIEKDKNNQLSSDNFSISLSTELTNDLIEERVARELVSYIQNRRKEEGLKITDRIKIEINVNSQQSMNSINIHKDYIKKETLCTDLNIVDKESDIDILDFKLFLSIEKA